MYQISEDAGLKNVAASAYGNSRKRDVQNKRGAFLVRVDLIYKSGEK